MMIDLGRYRTLVFDCDGVVLDSNALKTAAFRSIVSRYGSQVADRFVEYHERAGGVSRYEKFRHLFHDILRRQPAAGEVELLCDAYAAAIWGSLLTCEVARGLDRLREATAPARWMIVSGGDQDELRRLFVARRLDALFDGGIFGSPDSKVDILRRLRSEGNLRSPAVFLGDSAMDYESAQVAGIDFIFVHGWSDNGDWRPVAAGSPLQSIESLDELVPQTAIGVPARATAADVDSSD